MKFISYEIRQVCIDPLGVDVVPVSEMQPEKVPKPTFWSLYGRAPADSDGRCLIENVWDAPSYIEIRRTYQRLTGCDLTETPQDHYNLPVDPPPNQRTHADDLTIAFVTIGAHDEYRKQTAAGSVFGHPGGYLGYIGDVTYYALMLDKVADYFDEHGSHPGVFVYEVAEEFGSQFGEKVMLGEGTYQQAKELLYAIMIGCTYDEDMLVEAFKGI